MVLLPNDASALVDEMSGCGLVTVDMASDDVDVGLFLSLPIYIYTLKKKYDDQQKNTEVGNGEKRPVEGGNVHKFNIYLFIYFLVGPLTKLKVGLPLSREINNSMKRQGGWKILGY